MVVEDTSKSEDEMSNVKATDPLDDPKASGAVLDMVKEDEVPVPRSLYLEQGDRVLTKDGKVAIVTRTTEINPENATPYNLIDAVVLEVFNGQPKLSAISKGKRGEDWKFLSGM